MIKACIFDLDGTLADTLSTIAEYGNIALTTHGYKKIEIETYKKLVGDGRDELVRRMLSYVGDCELKGFEAVKKTYSSLYEQNVTGETKAFEGIPELLDVLKRKSIKLAVLSNKQNEVVPAVVEALFGADCFDLCLGQSDAIKRKPAPDGANLIAEKLKVEPHEFLYIGDTNVDMLTGKAAKMNTVGVTWGFRDRQELVESGADYIINKPAELLELIK
jgi:phosphoglycolate phosphatase